MARPDDMLTTQDVAAVLGVTSPRVRQMVDEGKLAPPVEFGLRTHLWHRVDVLAAKLIMDGQRVSRTAAVMPTMDTPLTRIHDQLINYSSLAHEHHLTHVRVWEGPAPEGPRIVVLIGDLRDSPGVVNSIERIVQVIDQQLLNRRGHDAVWFDYRPSALLTRDDKHRIHNVILRYDDDHSLHGHDVAPSWRPTTIAEVERVVGEAVECYPAEAYTPSTIDQWQRARQTVDVMHDSVGLTDAITAFRAMAEVSPEHSRAELAHIIRKILATIIREKLREIDDLIDGRRGWGPSWDDGITPPQAATIGTAPPWPTTFAARLVPPRLIPDDEAQLANYPDKYPWPTAPDEAAQAMPLLEQIRHWSADTGPFSGKSVEPIYYALKFVQRRLTTELQRADRDRADAYLPTYQPLLLRVMGNTDRRYLGQILSWDPSPIETPHHRELAAQFSTEDHERLEYGVDPWQRLVARLRGSELSQPEEFAVQWPNKPTTDRPPDEANLLADGGDEGRDRPVYVEGSDGRLNLLPRDPDRLYSGWSFGYGGSGPSALVNAISRYISQVDRTNGSWIPLAWIDDQVTHSRRDHLQINLGDLRRRIR